MLHSSSSMNGFKASLPMPAEKFVCAMVCSSRVRVYVFNAAALKLSSVRSYSFSSRERAKNIKASSVVESISKWSGSRRIFFLRSLSCG